MGRGCKTPHPFFRRFSRRGADRGFRGTGVATSRARVTGDHSPVPAHTGSAGCTGVELATARRPSSHGVVPTATPPTLCTAASPARRAHHDRSETSTSMLSLHIAASRLLSTNPLGWGWTLPVCLHVVTAPPSPSGTRAAGGGVHGHPPPSIRLLHMRTLRSAPSLPPPSTGTPVRKYSNSFPISRTQNSQVYSTCSAWNSPSVV